MSSGPVGVLGGMGPAATIDFLTKLYKATPAQSDQDHIPVVVMNDPRIPDRSDAIQGKGASPLPALLDAVERLQGLGATLIVMPCNTAHHWFAELCASVSVRFLSIVEATMQNVLRVVPKGSKVAILATDGTLKAGFYQAELASAGFTPIVLPDDVQDGLIVPAIQAVKAGDEEVGRTLLHQAVGALAALGCSYAVLGCTELSLVFGLSPEWPGLTLIDSNTALASETVAWFMKDNAGGVER